MSSLFDNVKRSRIFKDQSVLSFDWVPEKLAYRGDELKRLATFFYPVLESPVSQNVLITGSVGTGTIHLFENDTGPDDANHAQDGVLIWRAPGHAGCKGRSDHSIYDIAPTVLDFFGLEIPESMIGEPILKKLETSS